MDIKNLRFIGRHIIKNEKPYFSFSGCGFEFAVVLEDKDPSITLKLSSEVQEKDYQYIAIFINDVFYSREKLGNGLHQFVINPPLGKEPIKVRVIKLNEVFVSSIYISDIVLKHASFVSLPSSKRKLIGFFGDSITCGYGILDYHGLEFDTELEDFTKTYAYLASFALNMDYSVVARSGISVAIPIYIEQLFKEIYDTVDMFNKCPQERVLDYATINLGTNDNGAYLEAKTNKQSFLETFKKEYRSLVERIISDNPNVKIIMCYKMLPLEDDIVRAIIEVYQDIKNNYQNECRLLEFVPNSDGGNYHPFKTAHEEASKLLIKTIQEMAKDN